MIPGPRRHRGGYAPSSHLFRAFITKMQSKTKGVPSPPQCPSAPLYSVKELHDGSGKVTLGERMATGVVVVLMVF